MVTDNARFYYMDYPYWTFPVINQVVRDKSGGAIVFPDGSRQTTSAGVSQQVRIGRNYTITLEDAGGHIFIDDIGGWWSYNVIIPYWEMVKLPVGFKFSIVNRSNQTVYVYLDSGPGPRGSIYGVQSWGYNNGSNWYINGNSNGANWVELIKVKEGFKVADNDQGPQWVIRGDKDTIGVD